MKRLLSIAVVLALAAARPETYKEQEDFQYSRSATDEGTKSGFYGAQRGNMGGNYERAHNMDGLAQHQMSSAVKQVEGELGDASKTRTGSVFTSANSGGLYGSGHYDLSNLQGRNFQEGINVGAFSDSQSHASLSSHHRSGYADQTASSLHSSGYNSHALNSGYGGYHGSKNYGQALQSSNLRTADNVHDAGYGYDTQAAATHSSGYQSQSGYNAHSGYDSSNINQLDSHTGYVAVPQSRLIVATPVRVVGRPGQRIAIPVGIQTYDATHSASRLDQNAIASDAEVLSNTDQHITYRPTSNAKRYESSFNYRKQWEKHDTRPEIIDLAIPTESPLPQNSELYDDTQASNHRYHASGINSQSDHTSSMHQGYNSNVKSAAASQSRYHSSADSQHSSLTSGSNSDAYTHGAHNSGASADTTNILGEVDLKPKGYQSSYSYHKSWERQGDPYVIKPVDGAYAGQSSQRLTAASSNHGSTSQQQGSQYHRSHQGYTHGGAFEDRDCDETGQIRVARSANQYDTQGQQSVNSWESFEDVGQQRQKQWAGVGEFRQQLQNKNEKLEDLGQQSQTKWENMENMEQQTQNKWDEFGKLSANKWEELGQQTQNKWEAFGKQTRNNWEELGQQTQNKWDNLHVGQSPNKVDKIEDLGQTERQPDLGQEVIAVLGKPEKNDLKYNDSGTWIGEDNLGQQFQTQWNGVLDKNQQNVLSQLDIFNKVWDDPINNPYQQAIFNNQQKTTLYSNSSHSNKSIHNTFTEEHVEQHHGETGQQVDQSWDVLNIFDQHKNEAVKPVWEQSKDDISTVASYNHPSFENSNLNKHNNQHFQGIDNVHGSNENKSNGQNRTQVGSSFDNLWEKIHDSKSIHTYKDKDENGFSGTTDSFKQRSYQDHQLNFSTVLDQTESKTETKPIIEEIRPQDIGRGDIGPETWPLEITPTEKMDTLVSKYVQDLISKLESSEKNQINYHHTPEQQREHKSIANSSISDDAYTNNIQEKKGQDNILVEPSYGSYSHFRPIVQEADIEQRLVEQQHQLVNFGQKKTSKNKEKRQNMTMLSVWGQNSLEFALGPKDQKLAENFGKQDIQDFRKHSNKLVENFGNSLEFALEPKDQKLAENFGKQDIQDFRKHSNKLVENFGNSLEFALGPKDQKLAENFGKQDIQDFRKHSNKLVENFGNSLEFALEQKDQKLAENFGKQDIQDFRKHSNKLVENFGNSLEFALGPKDQKLAENFGKQDIQDFRKHSNKLVENFGNSLEFALGPKDQKLAENFGKQDIQDFRKHSNKLVENFGTTYHAQSDNLYNENQIGTQHSTKQIKNDQQIIKKVQEQSHSQILQKSSSIESLEPTNNPGFWKTIKNKVISWFKS